VQAIPAGSTSKPLPESQTRVARLIIAIDGPAASGKSTTARLVADRLGFTYIDSGAMYRAVALKALREGVGLHEHDSLGRIAREARIELAGGGRGAVVLDGHDVTETIRSEKVSRAASIVSTVPEVRRALVAQQREIGQREDCVMEGRDIGTVVFPDADLKIFLVASLEARAKRRLLDVCDVASEDGAALEEQMAAISERDRRDTTRTDSPLQRAADAVEVDTTDLTIEQQVERVIELARRRGAGPEPQR
jgi:cytidylate kinase